MRGQMPASSQQAGGGLGSPPCEPPKFRPTVAPNHCARDKNSDRRSYFGLASGLQLQEARRGRNAADVRGCPSSRTKRGKDGATGLMSVLLIRLVSGESESHHGIAQGRIRIGLATERHGNVLASVYHVNHRRGGRGSRSSP